MTNRRLSQHFSQTLHLPVATHATQEVHIRSSSPFPGQGDKLSQNIRVFSIDFNGLLHAAHWSRSKRMANACLGSVKNRSERGSALKSELQLKLKLVMKMKMELKWPPPSCHLHTTCPRALHMRPHLKGGSQPRTPIFHLRLPRMAMKFMTLSSLHAANITHTGGLHLLQSPRCTEKKVWHFVICILYVWQNIQGT